MKILELDITNFGAVGEIKVALDDKGLVLILGDNQDDSSQESNGSGKSSVPDALCWCAYGVTAKGQTGDRLVNRTAKKETSVVMLIADEETDDVFRISRYRKHKTHKNMLRLELQQGPNWKDLTGGTDKITQVLVDKVIGCNHEVFKAAIYAGQEAMPDLPNMTDKNLKVLIEESAGIAQLQDASEISNRIVKERKAVVQDFAGQKDRQQSNVDLLTNNRLTLQTKQGDWEIDQQSKVDSAKTDLETAEAAFDKDLGDKIAKKKNALIHKADDIRSKIAGSDAERLEERRLSDEDGNAGMAEASATMTNKAKLEAAERAHERLKHVGDTVGTDCASCGHTIGEDDVAGNEAAIKQTLDNALEASDKALAALKQASLKRVATRKALDEYRASMTDVSALTSELTTIDDNQSKLSTALVNWQRQKTGVDHCARTLEALITAVNPNIALIEALDKQVEGIQDFIEELEEKRVAAAKELFIAEEAFRVFSPAGVRSHILDTVTPHLNARTSHYLSTLTDGNISAVWSTVSKTAKGELREKFVIDVESKTGGETFTDLSGGEKRKVRLACAMALQDLVASRAGKPIKLFIADEIDTALDAAGQERLMAVLDEKSRDKGTVLVISHNDLRDHIRNSVLVTKKGGKATIATNGVL